jgi:hypothetical protein
MTAVAENSEAVSRRSVCEQCLGVVATAAHGPALHARGCLGRLIVYCLLADGRHVCRVDLNTPRLERFGEFPLEIYESKPSFIEAPVTTM